MGKGYYCSLAHSCPALCDSIDRSKPGFPVLHRLLALAQTHVHWVGDAIHPSCPLLSPSPPTSFPASTRSFLMNQLFISRGQSIGVSVSVLVLPMNIQTWFPLGLTGWISLLSKGLSRVCSNTTVQSHQFFGTQLLHGPALTSTHNYWKTIVLTVQNFVGKVMSLLFNMLSRLVITFLPRSNCILVSWLQSPSAVILEPKNKKQNKVCHSFHSKW